MQIQISQNSLPRGNVLIPINTYSEKQKQTQKLKPKHTKDKIRFKNNQRNMTDNQLWLGLSREETMQKYQALLDKNRAVVKNTDNDLNLIHFASFDYLPMLKLLLLYKHQICIEVSKLKAL